MIFSMEDGAQLDATTTTGVVTDDNKAGVSKVRVID